MIEGFIGKVTVDASSSGADEIEIPQDNFTPTQFVIYVIPALGGEVDLASAPDESGLTIPAGVDFISGPYRAESGDRPRYLVRPAATTDLTDVDVWLLKGESSDGFVHESIGGASSSVQSSTSRLAGTQRLTPGPGSTNTIDPVGNGVSGEYCDIFIQNTGTEVVYVADQTQTEQGRELKPNDTFELPGHTAENADIAITTETNAGGNAQVDVLFRE